MSFRFCGDGLCDGMFRAPARGTFALSGKSTQKRCLNLRFKNPPALCSAFCWGLTPRVHRTRLFSLCMTNQLSSCVAAADAVRYQDMNRCTAAGHIGPALRSIQAVCYFNRLLLLYWMASARCWTSICSAPSRSAMVRAMRKMRSWLRPVRPSRSKAPCMTFSPAASSWQYWPIMAGVI